MHDYCFNYTMQSTMRPHSGAFSVFNKPDSQLVVLNRWALQPNFYHLVNDQGEAIKKAFPACQ